MVTIEQIAMAQNGDKTMRDRIVEENVGLVWSIVRRFTNRGYDAEELFQIGCIGLIKAIDKFDTNFEVKFSTYAVPLISGEIKRFLRDDGIVKVSRTLKENGWRIRKEAEKISHDKGREATIEELAMATGLAREDVVLAIEANSEVDSIYRTVYQNEGNDVCMAEILVTKCDGTGVGTTASENIWDDMEKNKLLDSMVLQQLIGELSERERELIRYRYFGEKTQSDVARKMGISQVQVSRLEKKILLQLRKKIENNL